MAISTFPEELKTKAGSLFEGPCPITRNSLICEIWKEFFQTDVDELVYLYKERSLVLGRTVTFEQNQQTYQGIAKDISDTGQLLVQLDKSISSISWHTLRSLVSLFYSWHRARGHSNHCLLKLVES